LLNLASACNAEESKTMWGFIKKYDSNLSEENKGLDKLVGYAVNYFNDFIKPYKKFKIADELYLKVLQDLKNTLSSLDKAISEEDLQTLLFSVAKKFAIEDFRSFFAELYQLLFGLESGPRMGSFIKIFGIDETVAIINEAIKREG
jgi:lysyl-tRNA synthetase class 1